MHTLGYNLIPNRGYYTIEPTRNTPVVNKPEQFPRPITKSYINVICPIYKPPTLCEDNETILTATLIHRPEVPMYVYIN